MKTGVKIGLLAFTLIFLNSCSKGSFGEACFEEEQGSDRIHLDIDWDCEKDSIPN